MADKKAAASAAKAKGNAAFSKNDFETAVKEFTVAIENDPSDHVFFSNRSASYASLNKFNEALTDATQCVTLKPDWAKGYSRQGAALYGLKKFEDAKTSYEKGASMEPNNAAFKEGIEACQKAMSERASGGANPMGKLFGEQMWVRLHSNPTTREYLNYPAFVQKLKLLQTNPNLLGSFANDPKMSAVL